MKTLSTLTRASAGVLLTILGLSAQAGTLINSFDSPFDYVANGIIGDTNWDGVYLRFGDIVPSSAGTDGNGNTLQANETAFGGGFLGIQNANGSWSGPDNDGFFIYKVVQGDFDVSVQNVPATFSGGTGFDSRGNNFAGLMVRAYHTNNSGSSFSTTSTNLLENSLRLWRFNEFNLDGTIRASTNGLNSEPGIPGSNNETNSPRFYRITRTGNTFQFYLKTNAVDAWVLITNATGGAASGYTATNGSITRSDWTGVALQVGICQAGFNSGAASRDAFFDDFQLTGTNITFPAMPPGPASIVTTATNTGGSLSFSWTANGGASSLVVMSLRPIQHNPVQGVIYNASSSFGDPNARLGGANEFVVYSGPGTSVTVTNLGANNLTYYIAVYAYSTASPPVYNTASPATASFPGPGVINNAIIAAVGTNVPVNGAVKLTLLATFSTGETSDQSAAATWGSDNIAVVGVNASGVVSGLAPGSATVTATFGPYSPATNITVHSPTFTDTFTRTNNYLTTGLIGTPYDGMFLNFGDVPGAVAGGDGAGSTITLDSQISNTNGLFMSSVQSTWSSTANDGPFLYKVVPGSVNGVSGDFQALVHINNMNALNGVFAGLMARLYNPANHGAGPGGAENHVNYWKQQNGTTSIRRTQGGAGGATVLATGPSGANGWLLVQRVASTNFNFFEKAGTNDLWTLVTNVVLIGASNNAPMEVGLAQQSTAGVDATTTFDSFMLDASGVISATPPPPPASGILMTLNLDLSMTISYTVVTNPVDGGFYRSVVIMRDGGPVAAQPYTGLGLGGNSVFGDPNNNLGDGNYMVYRSPAPTPTANQSVTVTGLIPGHTYYAAVYTFVGLGTTRTFNNDASTANSTLQDGVLLSLEVLPTPPIARGGLGFMQVIGHYTGGGTLNVSPFATITSDNTNVIKVQSGVLTGITNGTANVTLIYSGVTNVAAVNVRNPTFTDEFDANQDYLVSGVSGSAWQGLYNPKEGVNPVPASPYVPLAGSGATVADANVSSNGVLTITAAGDGWENDLSGGFFLYRYVPGDFQIAVQIQSMDIVTYNQPGLLARAYAVDTNTLSLGAPLGVSVPNANGTNDLGEYWVDFSRFDEFNIGTYPRRNVDSVVSQNGQSDPGPTAIAGPTGTDTNYWLLIVRSGGTEFDFYKRSSVTDTWKQVPNKIHYSLSQLAGQPMQVGIMSGPWSNPAGLLQTVHFDHFMLDATTGSPLTITRSGGNVILSWPPFPATLQSKTNVVSPTWQNVSGTPALGPTGYSLTLPAGPVPTFYRLVQ